MSLIGKTGVTGFNPYSFMVAPSQTVVLLFVYKAVTGRTV